MKKLFYLVLACVLMTACSGSGSYSIKGHVEGVPNGSTVTLNVILYNSLLPLDSAVVRNGNFTIKGKTDTCEVAILAIQNDSVMAACQFFLEAGKIVAEFDAEGGQRLSGTPNNNAYQEFYDFTDALNEEAEELEDKIRMTVASDGDCTSLYAQMGDLQDRFKALLANSICSHADKYYAYRQLIENYSLFEPDEVAVMLDALVPAFGQDEIFMQLSEMTYAQLATSLGQPYIDFEAGLLDKSGNYDKKVKFSDYVSKNKVVFLDFWASWCGPCMNEVPNLKAAYKKYHSKGFEIVSVSLDEDPAEWKDALKNNNMDWVQLWNADEDELEGSAAVKYSITAIPSTFLIDADGTIIGRNLRENELEDALEDYFSGK